MTQETTAGGPSALPTTLLILRLTLGVFLLQWAIEKLFRRPRTSSASTGTTVAGSGLHRSRNRVLRYCSDWE